MIPYIAYIIFTIFCCFCEILTIPLIVKRILYGVFLLITITLVGLRDSSIGFDTVNYFESFAQMADNKESSHDFESGYLLLVTIFQKFSTNPHLFLFVIAAVSIGIKFYALPRYSPMVFIPLAYCMAYYLTEYEMSGVRQGLALAFGLLAIYYARERRLYIFSAIIILGSFIHVSLLFFFPFYFFDRIKINRTTFTLLMVSCVALLLVDLMPVISKVIGILPAGSIIMTKVSSYMADDNMRKNSIGIGHLPYLLFALFFFYYSTVIKDKFYHHILAAFIIGVFTSFLLSSTLSVLNRLTYYYLVTGGILFAYIIYYSQHKANKVLYVLLLSMFLALKIMESILAPEAISYYIPYRTFFL